MFADFEDKILARLRAKLDPGVHVGPERDLERVPSLRQKAPAVWVVYNGFTIGSRIENVPQVANIVQQWYVVITTKSAKGNGAVESARYEAGLLCEQVIAALLGFDMGRGHRLRLEEAPGAQYDAGYCQVPLAFSNAATFRGTP
jgi:hypothetical protein